MINDEVWQLKQQSKIHFPFFRPTLELCAVHIDSMLSTQLTLITELKLLISAGRCVAVLAGRGLLVI